MADQVARSAGLMHITVVVCVAPRLVREVHLQLPPGSTVADALQASGLSDTACADVTSRCDCGVWGRKAPLGQLLRDLDRVEVYRALAVDPKVARRERFVRQGVRTSGLFARRRPGAKPGY